ncbi:MAG: arylsulfotransferase family protein, partial [Solirubrobacteraceae bacterium]
MGRARLAAVALALAACLALAIVLGTGALSSNRPRGQGANGAAARSPACLPSTLSHSARLPGLPLDVSPAPQTGTANPDTQISFLGVPAGELGSVSVTGQRSGAHSGLLRPYSQGDGASFLPATPFDPGEQVTVRATVRPRPGGGLPTPLEFSFRIDTPYSTAHVAPFPNPPASPAEYQSFRTLPGIRIPVLTVTAPDRDPGAGDLFMTNGPGPGEYGPLIYTPQGRLVWFMALPAGQNAENLSVQSYEGQRDLTFWQGKVLSLGYGDGEDIVMDSRYRVQARMAAGNGLHADLHELQLAGQHVAYITAYNPIRCDLSHVEGRPNGAILDVAIQEIDMRTGLVRWEWHSLDHVSVEESQTAAPANVTPWDWFHLNSIDPEPNGDLFISARSTWASYQLQAGTGNILWRLGGTNSSFRMGPGTETAWQHEAASCP